MDFHGRLYRIPKETREQRTEELLKLVELFDRRNDIVKTFSGGMRRRLEIARGLLHHPSVLFLDEPTLGLDPQTRNLLWQYIETLAKEKNITIILTTHYMEEADRLCNRIAIIDHGKIIALDTPAKPQRRDWRGCRDHPVARPGSDHRSPGRTLDHPRGDSIRMK